MVDDLFAGRQGVIKDNLGLERNRLLGLSHQLARSQTRTVLDDALDGFLGGLFLDYLSLVALCGELGGELLLAILTFLDNLGFTRLQVRVLANLGRERNRDRPRHVLRALSRLGADEHDLVDRLLGAFPGAVLLLFLRARLTCGFSPVFTGRDGGVVLVLDLERNFARRYVDDVHYRLSRVGGSVFIGHGYWDFDLRTRLGVCRCGRADLAVVVDGNGPTSRNLAQFVGVVLGNVDVVRLVELHRQCCGVTRVDRLFRVCRIRLPVVGQLHHCGDGRLRGQATRRINSHRDGVLVTRLGIRRRGNGDLTCCRVDGVFPAADFLGQDRLTIRSSEGERRALRCTFNLVLDFRARSSRLDVVVCLDVTFDDDDGADNRLRLLLAFAAVVSLDRNVEDVAFLRALRDRGRDLASLLVNEDCPRLAVLARESGLVGSILEGVARRGLVGSVAAQAALGDLRSKADARVWLTSHCVVGRDLDVHDRLELGLDLIGRLVRVGGLHLRGDDGAWSHRVVRLRGDLACFIDGDGPAVGHSGGVNLVLRWVYCFVALHDRLEANLGGEVFTDFALGQAWTHQVGHLGVVRVNNDE